MNLSSGETAIVTVVLIILGLFVVWIISKIVGADVKTIEQGKQVVIQRLGIFHKLAGPGLVVINRADKIAHEIDVRNRPRRVPVNGLFMNGIPFGYTLDIWYRTALEECAKGDKKRLAELSEFSDREREQLVATRVYDAMVKSATLIEKNYKPTEPQVFYKLLPVVPGHPENIKMMQHAKDLLVKTLPAIGVKLNTDEEIVIMGLNISTKLTDNFDRDRTIKMLKEQFPTLSEKILLQALSAIDEIKLPYGRVAIEGDEDDRVSVDVRLDEDHKPDVRFRKYAGGKTGKSSAAADEPDETQAEEFTDEDWEVLKEVPAA